MKYMMACCREDNSCVENNDGQEGFANGHILSVVTAQTIGKPNCCAISSIIHLHTSFNIVYSPCMFVPCMSLQEMGLVCEPARRSDLCIVISCLANLVFNIDQMLQLADCSPDMAECPLEPSCP